MNIAVTELSNAILKKPLHECSTDELRELVQQYPYFGPVQLLLAKKLSEGSNTHEDNSSVYEDQVQKTTLFFQNRTWLHYLLNDDVSSNTVTEHPVFVKKEIPAAGEEQYKPAEPVINENIETEISHDPIKEETSERTEAFVEVTDVNTGPTFGSVNKTNEAQLIDEPYKEEMAEQTEARIEMPSLKIEPITANTGLTFEPYHTVDYFASQGIKFKEDEKPKDRFSVQLKSFTEWLKTMKRIPTAEITAVSDTGSEQKVEQMAEHSIAERHVITEAMAEVWIKQGNKAKAEEIYHKLSLLDPSKSSYFAAKIEELKKTS